MKILSALSVQGFKSCTEAKLEALQSFNLLIGPNNRGKSSLLDAIAKLERISKGRYDVEAQLPKNDEDELQEIWNDRTVSSDHKSNSITFETDESDMRPGVTTRLSYTFDDTWSKDLLEKRGFDLHGTLG
ncbi:MAG: AAA family ATPase, partial [Planctomycetota bacterium]|nr:AAA family ATPase [Planctomycetota bacterium]